jgi:hypothetical protein
MRYRVWLLLVLGFSQLGCGIGRALLSDLARNRFSQQQSCPEDRLTMNAVPVRPQDLLTTSTPPPAVAADPDRLAVWQAGVNEAARNYRDLTLIHVSGCAVDRTYLCWAQRAPYGDELDHLCNEVDLSDASPRLGTFTLESRVMETLRERLATSPPSRAR